MKKSASVKRKSTQRERIKLSLFSTKLDVERLNKKIFLKLKFLLDKSFYIVYNKSTKDERKKENEILNN